MGDPSKMQPVSSKARQSPPLDLTSALKADPSFIRGKTIVITGGASGIGAGLFTAWAAHGATIIIGDIDAERGEELVEYVKEQTGNERLHFVRVDVKDWRSQLQFFRVAVNLSPSKGIDCVVANAGVNDTKESVEFESPTLDYMTAKSPPPPSFSTMSVNLYGVLYTTHLALYFLARNPGSQTVSPNVDVSNALRDRHLLLVGSLASLYPIPGQTMYNISKHSILALFRSLRMTAPIKSGVRVNLLCPYFIDTPIISHLGRALLTGAALANKEDAVAAATRFVADPTCIGRALVVAPRLKVRSPTDEDGNALAGAASVPDMGDVYELMSDYEKQQGEGAGEGGSAGDFQERAVWECYAHDMEDSDLFTRRVLKLSKAATKVRGARGTIKDMAKLVSRPIRRRFGGEGN
ncbi:hypothetical protein FQN54_004421 [Arachnomyces sp. PD_36]|nr:hypothetical protein FQN54_004421 [Arachnomyces sp. PD_36]